MFLRKINCRRRYFIVKRFINVDTSFKENTLQNTSPKSHIYKKTLFSSHKDLTSYLLNDLICNENGLVVLNKPYGLKKIAINTTKNKFQAAIHPSVSHMDHLNFEDALPHLSKLLNVGTLEPVKFPDRYASGVSFLSSDQNVTKVLKKCLTDFQEPYTYLAICVGIPKEAESFLKLGLTFATDKNQKKAILVDEYSKRALERKLVIPFVVHHRTLSVNEDLNVSLVQLRVNRNRWNCVRLYCATRLFAPCLSDWLLAPRLKYINNVPVVVDPLSAMANVAQKLPSNILNALMIKNNDEKSIPLHFHLVQVDLKKYRPYGKTLIAKPPNHFLWTCEQLNVSVPEYYLQNCDLPFTEGLQAAVS